MRLIFRFLVFLGLAWLAFVLFREARALNSREDVDASRVVLLFAAVLLIGGLASVLFVIKVLPLIGDMVGNFFFQPNQRIDRSPHESALAAIARGDYEAAMADYEGVVKANPADHLAYSEIARILCEHLGNPAQAAETLDQALQEKWPPEDEAFLMTRLADVHWKFQRDAARARATLRQIIEAMPGTRHAADAEHRLREIDQQIALEG